VKVRAGSGWQTVLADLSLILFMLTASLLAPVMGRGGKPPQRPEPAASPAPAEMLRGDPVAVWRPGAGGPGLAEWLAQQGADPRQRLTLVVPFAPGGEAAALERARSVLAAVPVSSRVTVPSRVIVEPGDAGQVYAALTFDLAGDPAGDLSGNTADEVARALQDGGQRP
jgi:hypothetical protein